MKGTVSVPAENCECSRDLLYSIRSCFSGSKCLIAVKFSFFLNFYVTAIGFLTTNQLWKIFFFFEKEHGSIGTASFNILNKI